MLLRVSPSERAAAPDDAALLVSSASARSRVMSWMASVGIEGERVKHCTEESAMAVFHAASSNRGRMCTPSAIQPSCMVRVYPLSSWQQYSASSLSSSSEMARSRRACATAASASAETLRCSLATSWNFLQARPVHLLPKPKPSVLINGCHLGDLPVTSRRLEDSLLQLRRLGDERRHRGGVDLDAALQFPQEARLLGAQLLREPLELCRLHPQRPDGELLCGDPCHLLR